jgi:ElaB/YqjD/DUF883 family membrane-anchored ribosome-binding protein
MEPNTQNQPQPIKPSEAATATVRAASAPSQRVADKMSDAAHDVLEHIEERGAEIIDQAKQKAGAAYEQANQRVSEQYEKALDYGRENPGITALLAFGLGVGVGLLLVGSFSTLRNRGAS